MEGGGIPARALLHAAGGLPGGGAQDASEVRGVQGIEQRPERGGLAGAGSAGDDTDGRARREEHGRALLRCQSGRGGDGHPCGRAGHESGDVVGEPGFHAVLLGEEGRLSVFQEELTVQGVFNGLLGFVIVECMTVPEFPARTGRGGRCGRTRGRRGG